MKRIHTQAKKARRASGFHKGPASSQQSQRRYVKRYELQPKRPKTFGLQIVRHQKVRFKKDQFGAPVYKTINHAANTYQGPKPAAAASEAQDASPSASNSSSNAP